MNSLEKQIPGFDGYTITDDGKVISYKFKTPRVMRTWLQKSGYENIKLCRENKTYHFLIHRLVAQAFIPNPDNLPEVNHKNKKRADNRVDNLEWSTRKDNLYDSYSTMSPVRNHVDCILYDSNGDFVEEFSSVKAAAEYAYERFNTSISGMMRNYESKGCKIVRKSVETKKS